VWKSSGNKDIHTAKVRYLLQHYRLYEYVLVISPFVSPYFYFDLIKAKILKPSKSP